MKYMSSKSKIAKSLLALMLKNRTANQVLAGQRLPDANEKRSIMAVLEIA